MTDCRREKAVGCVTSGIYAGIVVKKQDARWPADDATCGLIRVTRVTRRVTGTAVLTIEVFVHSRLSAETTVMVGVEVGASGGGAVATLVGRRARARVAC